MNVRNGEEKVVGRGMSYDLVMVRRDVLQLRVCFVLSARRKGKQPLRTGSARRPVDFCLAMGMAFAFSTPLI